jgi:hypothetical protein
MHMIGEERMFRRGESVPFAFVAEAERFRSNVAPPPRERASAGQLAGRALIGLVVAAGLVGSLLLGMPALDAERQGGTAPKEEASQGR